MSNQQFELIGHRNPFGRYPNIVIPVGKMNGKDFVAVAPYYASNEVIDLGVDEFFVSHNFGSKASLAPFDYKKHGLFAFTPSDIRIFSLEDEKLFFDGVLRDFSFSASNPYVRLSLAKRTDNIYTLIRETIFTLVSVNTKVAKRDFIKKWYSAHLRSLNGLGNNMTFPARLKFTTKSESEIAIADLYGLLVHLRKFVKKQDHDVEIFEKSIDEVFDIKADFVGHYVYKRFEEQVGIYYLHQNNTIKSSYYLERRYSGRNDQDQIRDELTRNTLEKALHELQVRLQALLSHSENIILEAESQKPKQTQISEMARRMMTKTEETATIVNNLGIYQPYHVWKKEKLNRLLYEGWNAYKSEADDRNIRLRVNLIPIEGQEPEVEMSRQDMKLAIDNLLHNAIKYSFRGSTDQERVVKVDGAPEGNYYRISISNYGVGINQSEIDKGLIFKDGYRGVFARGEARTGSGIGLTFVKRIIELHKGTIKVESARTSPQSAILGTPYLTTFTIRLPIVQTKKS